MPVAAAGLAGLAAALAVRRPQRPPRPGRGGPEILEIERHRLVHSLAARPDAVPLRRRVLAGLSVGGVGAVVAWQTGLVPARGTGGPLLITTFLAGGLAILAVVVLGRLEPGSTRRRRQQLVMATPQALELLSACLDAGLPLRRAVGAVVDAADGPIVEVFGSVLRLIELGMPEADAWRTLRGDPQLGAAAVELARAADSGTMLVEALRHHARTARERRQTALQVRARAVGVRAVLPMMCCFLPAFLLIGVVPAVVSAILHAFN